MEQPAGPADRQTAFERLAIAFAFLLTTRGAPLIYYGDEIGMPGAGDPDNRRFMQWERLQRRAELLFATASRSSLAIRAAHPATAPRHPDHASAPTPTPSPTR